ncbi:MAG TPA: DUF6101 family protein [Rhodoblastus sp.]|nr:DUF6101 family protein [Rhodoblastus sp.]
MSARPALAETAAPRIAWQGLAIGVEERNGRFLYRVRMVHEDPVQAATLVQTEDEREAVAAWRYWSASLRLPRLVERAPGDFHALEWRCGALVVRARAARRRGSPLFGRRPARCAIRKVGARDPMPVHAGEREIIART